MTQGEDVRFVQDTLLKLGYQPGKADGIYGKNTAAAVKAFQADHHLEVDGVVGSKTWAALEKQPEAPAPEAEESQDPEDQSHQGAPPDYGTRLLKYIKGRAYMTGADVISVQSRLLELGHDPGKVDGKYGPKTEATVRLLQADASIKVDGIVGPDTRAALAAGSKEQTAAVPVQAEITPPKVTIRIKMTRPANIEAYGDGEVQLDIEEYLRGVVPSEMYESADIEALKAQAICARTYAYRRRDALLSDTANHQAFNASKIGACPRSDEAIRATKGQVLSYGDKLVDCFYSASNNGVTKRSGDVWSTHYPYYVTKTDEWDEAARAEKNTSASWHGIGLSQHGAMWAAKNGISCSSILAFYYDGAVIAENYLI